MVWCCDVRKVVRGGVENKIYGLVLYSTLTGKKIRWEVSLLHIGYKYNL